MRMWECTTKNKNWQDAISPSISADFRHPAGQEYPEHARKRPQMKPSKKKPGARSHSPSSRSVSQDQGWDPVAAWYDKLVGESGSDYHRNVILPAALRMLAPSEGESIIDVCCGQGVLAAPLLEKGIVRYTGVDASPRLIAAAKARHGSNPRVSFLTADACHPGKWADASHDAAACLMAVHDVPDARALFVQMAAALKPGGRALLVLMHPCFRVPKHTHWGWDGDQKIQYRRIDRYGTSFEIPVTTHPGKGTGEQTQFHHRSLSEVITALGAAGMPVSACEELFSHRRSQGSGPFSKAEHRAAEEIPLFIALLASKHS
jgi:ubiquinone/menaquinone biosynthesis C-methylase UbiE